MKPKPFLVGCKTDPLTLINAPYDVRLKAAKIEAKSWAKAYQQVWRELPHKWKACPRAIKKRVKWLESRYLGTMYNVPPNKLWRVFK